MVAFDIHSTAREKMVNEQIIARGITHQATINALLEVPRHMFVDDALQSRAYGDHPLPVAEGQTISQPYIVAYMTEALQLEGDETVLEIGTGSGYQAAVLSRICKQVYTVERMNPLLSGARKVFSALRYFNILPKLDDGTVGWQEYAPYDAIIVTAGGPEIPQSLIDQLAESGRMIIPVGERYSQRLKLVVKSEGEVTVTDLAPVRFVDLVGEYGW